MTGQAGDRPPPRPDVRLENGPMQVVDCAACGATVEARKSSWDQTSVQWHADALALCEERKEALPHSERPNRNAFLGCSRLKESLRAAAVDGRLSVQDVDPLKTNPEAHQ